MRICQRDLHAVRLAANESLGQFESLTRLDLCRHGSAGSRIAVLKSCDRKKWGIIRRSTSMSEASLIFISKADCSPISGTNDWTHIWSLGFDAEITDQNRTTIDGP